MLSREWSLATIMKTAVPVRLKRLTIYIKVQVSFAGHFLWIILTDLLIDVSQNRSDVEQRCPAVGTSSRELQLSGSLKRLNQGLLLGVRELIHEPFFIDDSLNLGERELFSRC